MAMPSSIQTRKPRRAPTPRQLPATSRKQLIIDTSASPEQWRELFRTLEDLARLGETIDCSAPPMECQYSSTPLRGGRPRPRFED